MCLGALPVPLSLQISKLFNEWKILKVDISYNNEEKKVRNLSFLQLFLPILYWLDGVAVHVAAGQVKMVVGIYQHGGSKS